MFPRQKVKTVAHSVEFLSFVQDRNRMHGDTAFCRGIKAGKAKLTAFP